MVFTYGPPCYHLTARLTTEANTIRLPPLPNTLVSEGTSMVYRIMTAVQYFPLRAHTGRKMKYTKVVCDPHYPGDFDALREPP